MKIKRMLILWFLSVFILVTVTGCKSNNNSNSQEPISRTEFLMDTIITLKIFDKQDEKILNLAVDRLKEIENRMSITIDDSDVSIINKNAGIEPVQVHDDVYYVIKKAKYYATISNGAYDPTIGPLARLWNVTGSEERERDSIPTEEQILEKKSLVDYNDLELMEDNKVYLKRKGMQLDLGGIVKGYAADEVKRIFLENGVKSAIINLGGNIYALGEKADESPWNIGVTNPFQSDGSYMGVLKAKDKSIVTSGDYERYFEYNGKRYHHILDYRTGYPTDNELTSVSIISDYSIDGDALSTTLFVLGVEDGLKLLEDLEGIEVIFVTKDKKVIVTDGIKDQFDILDEEFKITN